MVVEIYFDPVSVCNRLTPEEVQRRNYNANVRRGKITDQTTFFYDGEEIKVNLDNLDKIHELIHKYYEI